MSHLHASPAELTLMPMPAEVRAGSGRFTLTENLRIAFPRHTDERLRSATARALRRWEQRTGVTFSRTREGSYVFDASMDDATLVIDCASAAADIPELGEDESYSLEVLDSQIKLRAPTALGAQRGLETMLQLLDSDATSWFVPAFSIQDAPRFPWRGLLIDVCRHWQPIEVIKRNLDGMALVKMNVLHLHLTEDQGFRIESKRFPRLHELGSDGLFFTQDEIREIVAYAADRGIRVVPEFDIPGHATSWLVGHPELASGPGPYVIERTWGVFDPTLDPTNEQVYELLDGIFEEMAALFPDPYFHIGGDENNGVQWSANPRIQTFIDEHGLEDNHGLQAYFNRRLQKILEIHGKKLVGWDEILHPQLPKSAIIQSWRGPAGLAEASRAGHSVILSNGYYIDLIFPARDHYLNDPLPADNPLTPEEQRRVLGGEATMWSEWVTPETIDSRIWPRTAAIAERLWSPREVRDVDDMYRRLEYASLRLGEAGLQHERNRPFLIRRYAGDRATPQGLQLLAELISWVEPVKGYRRGQEQPGTTQHRPLTGLADCAAPDSAPARNLARVVDAVMAGETPPHALTPALESWVRLGEAVSDRALEFGPRSTEVDALAVQLRTIAGICLELLAEAEPPADAALDTAIARLQSTVRPVAAVELPAARALKLLLVAFREQENRGDLSADAWREQVEAIAFPVQTP